MKNNLQALREYQSRVDLSELEKSIYISIDRLTVILDRDNCSLRRIFWELRNSIDSIIQEFSIQANLKEDYFTLYKMINEDSINLIFFQLSTYGGYQVIRLDFNPNSLKEKGLWLALSSSQIALLAFSKIIGVTTTPNYPIISNQKGVSK